jgi:hypothetical protein
MSIITRDLQDVAEICHQLGKDENIWGSQWLSLANSSMMTQSFDIFVLIFRKTM